MPSTPAQGYFALVLHSHLPYVVDHGTWPHGVDWLYEAAAETYVPLLDVLNDLLADGIPARITIGITPVLGEQLDDERFRNSFSSYLEKRIEAAANDAIGFREHGDEPMAALADWWHARTTRLLEHFEHRYGRDLIGAFRSLQNAGAIEIITCAATHGYLPLLGDDACVRAQVHTGAVTSERLFGTAPHGIWLPECAYRPAYGWTPPVEGFGDARHRAGVEQVLQHNDLRYFVVDTHLLRGGTPLGTYFDRFEALHKMWEQSQKAWAPLGDEPRSPHAMYQVTPEGTQPPVRVFGRDPRTSLQVWSASHGYPGDPAYLEFHKKNFPGGLRYWRVTGPNVDLGDKQRYDPALAAAQVPMHADHFASLVSDCIVGTAEAGEGPAIVTVPFDTELFGHWWAEGPEWIGQVLRRLHADPAVEVATLGRLNSAEPPRDLINLPEGSWGEGGYHNVWLNEDTIWTWPQIYQCEYTMTTLATACRDRTDEQAKRLLNQLARTLLLLESSDWQFLITTEAARDYAEMRLANHRSDFDRLAAITRRVLLEGGTLEGDDEAFVAETCARDRLFRDLDFRWWAENGVNAPDA